MHEDKATAIVKEGLAPDYIKNLAFSLAPQPFYSLMDESNDAIKNLRHFGQNT